MIISVRRNLFDSEIVFARVEMSNEFVEITPCNTMHVFFEIDARKSFLIGST